MKAELTWHTSVALIALCCVLVISTAAWYIHKTFNTLDTHLVMRIESHTQTLRELADLTDRNGADPLTESIIGDCPRRAEFESLLNSLGTASRRDLMSTQQLFESCGSFYAERKALMVAELNRQYAGLTDALTLLALIRDLTPAEQQLSTWENLIVLEENRSELLQEQTKIQADIIRLLIESATTDRVRERVNDAQNIAESLTVLDTQIDALRKQFSS